MMDLLGMFRRRPAKRGKGGFARSREDITALGDSMGEMLHEPGARCATARPHRALADAGTAARRKTCAPPGAGESRTQDQWRGRASSGAAGRIPGCA